MKCYDISDDRDLDIAVVGVAVRFPGANNIEEFWANLCSGTESITALSDESILAAGVGPALLESPDYVKCLPEIGDPGLFDASFFGYSPKEAQCMDPQHRIFLETAWQALENAGYDADRYPGPIGVYGGSSMNMYLLTNGLPLDLFAEQLAIAIGNEKDYLTTRVSYKMNLKGPSITVQTACSTSLVAVHMACQGLLNAECDMALAGGVSVRLPHNAGYLYQDGNIQSPDGHCRTFDARARGTVFGSGVGMVVLKRLADAINDGDSIYAVIKGTAVNNDGASKATYTSPSVDSQTEVILQALANAAVGAETITYVEAHGTGTVLGDPIEVAALTNAFRAHTDRKGYCAIGSVKTNFGHLDAAAGVASLVKTILALKHGAIPPSLHFERANPQIDFENSPFYVSTELSSWKCSPHLRRAAVNSLGVGGTNVHVILEEPPAIETAPELGRRQLLLVSAKTEAALEGATTNLAEHLDRVTDQNLSDVAYTLQVGRKVFDHRRMIVCRDREDVVRNLRTLDPKSVRTAFQEPVNRDVAFLFSGQGSQYPNMGRQLYETERVFRDEIDRCSAVLRPHLERDLRKLIYPEDDAVEEAGHLLKQTSLTQPALFAVEYALAKLWMAWGILPCALVGHSIGEYVAACLAGVFSVDDALTLVAARGHLMQTLPEGAMLAIPLPEEEVRLLLDADLALAVINGPSQCVVSGDTKAVNALERRLAAEHIEYRRLHTSHAFHSPMMQPIVETFTERVAQVKLSPPHIPFVSNVTGSWIVPEQATSPTYWAAHLRQTVRFSDCLQTLMQEPNRVLLEVGPGRTLCTLSKRHPGRTTEHVVLSSIRHPNEQVSDDAFVLNAVGQLWLAGINVDWRALHDGSNPRHVPLPTYPFERKHHWITSGKPLRMVAVADSSEDVSVEEPPHLLDSGDPDASGNDEELLIASIWRDCLGVEQVDPQDNFFELGGNSLIAVRVVSRIRNVLGARLSVSCVFENPTIETLAAAVKKIHRDPEVPGEDREEGAHVVEAVRKLGLV